MQVGLAFLEVRSINGFVQWLMTFVAQESCSPASTSGRTGNHKCCHLANIDIAFLLSPTQCISLRVLHNASQSLCRTQRNMRNELDNVTLGGALMAEYFRILWATFSHCVHRVHMSNESLLDQSCNPHGFLLSWRHRKHECSERPVHICSTEAVARRFGIDAMGSRCNMLMTIQAEC